MATARDYCTDALRDAGISAEGQPIPAEMAQRALRLMNRIIAGWNAERLMKPVTTSGTATATATVTIGPTGDIVTDAAPIGIEAVHRDGVPLRIVTPAELLSFAQATGEPACASYNPTQPDGTVTLWPTPSASASVVVSWLQDLDGYSINDTVTLPSELANAMQWSLASAVAKAYGFPRPDLEQEAAKAMTIVRLNNVNYGRMRLTPGLAGCTRVSDLYSL